MLLSLHVLRTLLACTGVSLPVGDSGASASDSGPVVTDDSAAAGPLLFVNELMAASESSYLDAEGLPVDWVELYNPGAAAVDLEGWSVSDDWTEPRRHVFAAGLSVPAGGFLVLEAAGAETPGGGTTLSFSLDSGGESVGVFDPEGEAVDWVGFSRQRADYARARIPDGGASWTEMPVGTPGASNGVFGNEEALVVEVGSTWAYHDRGQDLGEAWRAPDYDDSGWDTGPAPLGYGDDLATEVASGGSGSRNPTTYFRHRFQVDATLVEGAYGGHAALQVDDGAVVWLNGEELGRVRMASGAVRYDTWASETASGGTETSFTELDLDLSLLRAGENVLAVEVHQANASSSDIRLDLELLVLALVEAE
ncbi:MAG: lamin tail domain-containing protein [Alphaproteobacteria bacterium]|nr:lamin tail domain-containing protein [Alphaproteobacteria bacterium]